MLPLKISHLFEQLTQPQRTIPVVDARPRQGNTKANDQALSWSQQERRENDDRRSSERREKKDATFLDTRKIQGRRRSAGRRATDQRDPATHIPFSIKG